MAGMGDAAGQASRGGAAGVESSQESKTSDDTAEPVFEMVVLGSGGGPLETDCSG